MMAVNLRAPLFLAQAALPHLRERGGGSIINIGSIEGLGANPDHAAYCASKAGIHGMTRAMAVDLGADNIRCNAIAPGWIASELSETYLDSYPDPAAARDALNRLHPLGRVGRPTDVGDLAVYLASDRSSFLTGEVVVLDGGRTAKLPCRPEVLTAPTAGVPLILSGHQSPYQMNMRRMDAHDHPARAVIPPRRPGRPGRPSRCRLQPGGALLHEPGDLRPGHGGHLHEALAVRGGRGGAARARRLRHRGGRPLLRDHRPGRRRGGARLPQRLPAPWIADPRRRLRQRGQPGVPVPPLDLQRRRTSAARRQPAGHVRPQPLRAQAGPRAQRQRLRVHLPRRRAPDRLRRRGGAHRAVPGPLRDGADEGRPPGRHHRGRQLEARHGEQP